MKMTNPHLIARMLRQVADKIDNGSCGLDDEEMLAIGQMMVHRKLNIEQVCQHFGISRATLNRWQQCGKLPPFRKDSGGKDFLWLDEAEEAVNEYESD